MCLLWTWPWPPNKQKGTHDHMYLHLRLPVYEVYTYFYSSGSFKTYTHLPLRCAHIEARLCTHRSLQNGGCLAKQPQNSFIQLKVMFFILQCVPRNDEIPLHLRCFSIGNYQVVASIAQKMIYQRTLPETDIAPENRSSKKRKFIFQPLISRGNSFLQGGYSPRNPVRKWISDFCFLEDFLPEKKTKQPQKTSQQISKKSRRLQSELPPPKKKGAVRPKFKIDTHTPKTQTNDNGKFQRS